MTGKNLSQKLLESTAGWTAAVRAAESKREDRLFDDPWAQALAGEQGFTWLAGRPADTLNSIVIRTRNFDDFLQEITYRQGIEQVVLVAAGLGTRAYRLKWPERTGFLSWTNLESCNTKKRSFDRGAQPRLARSSGRGQTDGRGEGLKPSRRHPTANQYNQGRGVA